MTIFNKNKTTEAALAKALSAGTQKHLSTMPQMIVAGSTVTPAQAEAQLDALAALRDEVTAARTTLNSKVALEKAQIPALRTFLLAFVAYVRGTFGNTPDILADFGLAPRKVPAARTPGKKTAAVAKAEATRAARGTMGPKAKLAVKGNVTGIVVTPVTSAPPAAHSVAAAPVQPALSASSAAPQRRS